MPRAKKPCNVPGCPTLVSGRPRCPTHQREWEQGRGSRQQRGYDAEHDGLRRALEPVVQAGAATCWRCTKPIDPDQIWHLGHDDHDRSIHRGPEHADCNLSAAGRSAHR